MTDPVLRLLVVGVLAVAAVGIAFAQRRGFAHRRRTRMFPGVGPGVVVFTSAACSSCGPVLDAVRETGVAHRVVEYETEPELFRSLKIARVPAVAKVGGDERGWIAFGVLSPGRLGRWLDDP